MVGNIDVSVEGGSVHAVPGFFEFAGVSCCCLSYLTLSSNFIFSLRVLNQ